MRRVQLLGAALAVLVAACSPAPPGAESPTETSAPDTTVPAAQSTTSTTMGTTSTTTAPATGLPVCDHDAPWPAAPEAWYDDTPVYVGNNSPTDTVRRFASGMPGFETVWIDRDNNGWVSVGFVGVDTEEAQAILEAEFPEEGVVAVELPYTRAELELMMEEVQTSLPEDMHAGYHELRGMLEIYVGLLIEENVALAAEAAGDRPFCVDGLDPETHDQTPQQDEGEGWVFLGVVDTWLAEAVDGWQDTPVVITDSDALGSLWTGLGLDGQAPEIDFSEFVVAGFPVGYSGSCPDTRFDGVLVEGDRLMADIGHTTIAAMCTSDYNPRTYVVALERSGLPAPPVYFVEWEHSSQAFLVNTDLREPGSVIDPAEDRVVDVERPRTATSMPYFIEPAIPWVLTVPVECDLTYLGDINGVGWHLTEGSEVPDAWVDAAVDGLLDLEIALDEDPPPSLTASAAGEELVYEPGQKPTPACSP